MVITYYGQQCFKVAMGDTTIAVNPVSKKSSAKAPRFGADIALVSLHHPDFNGVEQVTHGGKEPFVARGAGEYEVKNVMVRGILNKVKHEKEERYNTIYVVTLEDITLCFLGAMSHIDIDDTTKEKIGDVDILFVPTGGDLLSADDAHKISTRLAPHVVIPSYQNDKALTAFLKEFGLDKQKANPKLTIKKKDLEGKEGEVVVLEAQ